MSDNRELQSLRFFMKGPAELPARHTLRRDSAFTVTGVLHFADAKLP